MSNRAPGRGPAAKTGTEKADTTPGAGPATPGNRASGNRRRQAREARLAAARAAERRARRRRQAILSAVLAVVVAGVIVGLALWLTAGTSDHPTAAAAATPSASPSAAACAGQAVAGPAVAPSLDPALSKKPVVTKGDGELTELKVVTLIKGKGAPVQPGQTITVNYVGVTYADGKEFDSSWSRSQPASFAIGVGQVIKGWDQGLVCVPVGSRVQLDIPQALAYPNPTNGQPAGALRFVVDILSAS